MANQMENLGTIYDEEKRINDSDIARAIAEKEENEGRKAARGLEQEFEQEAKTGGKKLREAAKEEMNTTEEYVTKLIDKLHEKFPLVPTYQYENSRCFLVPFEGNGPMFESKGYWFLDKDGMFTVNFSTSLPLRCDSINVENVIEQTRGSLEIIKTVGGPSDWEHALEMGVPVYPSETRPLVDAVKYNEGIYRDMPKSLLIRASKASDYGQDLNTITRAFGAEQKKYENIANAKDKVERTKKAALEELEKL